jgi:hypothetical protein
MYDVAVRRLAPRLGRPLERSTMDRQAPVAVGPAGVIREVRRSSRVSLSSRPDIGFSCPCVHPPTTLGVSPVRRLSLFGVRVKFCTSRSNWSGYRRPTRSRSRYRSRDPPSVHPLTWPSRSQAELFSSPDSSAISAENPDARSARIHHVQRMDSAELQRGLQSPVRASASLPSLFQRSETSTREIREEWYET